VLKYKYPYHSERFTVSETYGRWNNGVTSDSNILGKYSALGHSFFLLSTPLTPFSSSIKILKLYLFLA